MALCFSQNFRRRNKTEYFIRLNVKECINNLQDCYNMATFVGEKDF